MEQGLMSSSEASSFMEDALVELDMYYASEDLSARSFKYRFDDTQWREPELEDDLFFCVC